MASGDAWLRLMVAAGGTKYQEGPDAFSRLEVTIQQIMDECANQHSRVDTVLLAWRSKLEKELSLLQPFQNDEIALEVQLS